MMFKKLASVFKDNFVTREALIIHDIHVIAKHITAAFPELKSDQVHVAVETDNKNKVRLSVQIDNAQETVDRVAAMLTSSRMSSVKRYGSDIKVEKMSDAQKMSIAKMHELLASRGFTPYPYV